jgi:Flp pilus assembly protein TadG
MRPFWRPLTALRARGSALVEAAILLPLFLLVLFGIVESGRLLFAKVAVENATQEAGRFAVTGTTAGDASNPVQALSRSDRIKQFLATRAPGVVIDRARITIVPSDGGRPGDVVTITVEVPFTTSLPILGELTSGEIYTIRTSTVMKNEPAFTRKRRT